MTNSATTAPITDSEIAIRSPLKTKGTAFGSRMSHRSWTKEVRMTRDRSTTSRGVDRSPVTVETSSGKKAIKKVIVVRDSCPATSRL